jgi:nucleoside-diphosphate-sugar epimerase
MRVFLTGANGFVGSHILDRLKAGGCDVAIMLRKSSDTAFIADHVKSGVAVTYGSLSDAGAVKRAMEGADVVVHCAGKTRALHEKEYFAVNRDGTEIIVRAANAHRATVRHLVLVSTLAVSGPGVPSNPAREADPPRPVSLYGRSKLAGEDVVRNGSEVPWTILRPAAVYGPRDRDFLTVFRAVRGGVALLPQGGRQWLSLVYVSNLAEAVRHCLERAEAFGKIYHVAAEPPFTTADLVGAVAAAIGRRARTVSVPDPLVYMMCGAQEWLSLISRRPHTLSRQKWPELQVAGWACATDRLRNDLGFTAATPLDGGLARTVAWYREMGWL